MVCKGFCEIVEKQSNQGFQSIKPLRFLALFWFFFGFLLFFAYLLHVTILWLSCACCTYFNVHMRCFCRQNWRYLVAFVAIFYVFLVTNRRLFLAGNVLLLEFPLLVSVPTLSVTDWFSLVICIYNFFWFLVIRQTFWHRFLHFCPHTGPDPAYSFILPNIPFISVYFLYSLDKLSFLSGFVP